MVRWPWLLTGLFLTTRLGDDRCDWERVLGAVGEKCCPPWRSPARCRWRVAGARAPRACGRNSRRHSPACSPRRPNPPSGAQCNIGLDVRPVRRHQDVPGKPRSMRVSGVQTRQDQRRRPLHHNRQRGVRAPVSQSRKPPAQIEFGLDRPPRGDYLSFQTAKTCSQVSVEMRRDSVRRRVTNRNGKSGPFGQKPLPFHLAPARYICCLFRVGGERIDIGRVNLMRQIGR